jgi:GrpB-like predicted nucleotidyltransferase (UPF0157 family)
MLQPIPVVLADYDPEWPCLAARYAEGLDFLGGNLVTVHHFGSTSVPGLVAKPIIDLIPLVKDMDALDAERARMEAMGYGWHGEYGIKGRRFCTLNDAGGERLVNFHFFRADSQEIKRHIAFRDYLRAHPDIAKDYGNEKRRAQSLHPENSHKYSDEKDAWIRAAELRALEWFSKRPAKI